MVVHVENEQKSKRFRFTSWSINVKLRNLVKGCRLSSFNAYSWVGVTPTFSVYVSSLCSRTRQGHLVLKLTSVGNRDPGYFRACVWVRVWGENLPPNFWADGVHDRSVMSCFRDHTKETVRRVCVCVWLLGSVGKFLSAIAEWWIIAQLWVVSFITSMLTWR